MQTRLATRKRSPFNGKPARASYDVKEGDIIEINIGAKPLKVRVLDVKEFTKKEDAAALYEVV